MSPYPSPISNELIREAHAYWLTKRGVRNMPSRADVDPTDLTRILPHVMLVDVLGPTHYRLRLVGTACTTAHGADATGKTLDEALKDDRYRSHVIGLYDKCVAERRPLYSESLFFRNGAGVDRHVKVIFLPLSNDGTTVNMVFVVQIIGYADDLAQKNHLTAANPHREIVHTLL